MKKQTFIADVISTTGNRITFERFTCSRPATVKKHMQQLFTNDLYKACTPSAARIEVYATPDGYNRNPEPVTEFEV